MKILVVEKDNTINDLLANILRDEKYKITQVFLGTEEKFCLKEEEYQVISLDLMLTGISGEALIKEIKENYKSQIITCRKRGINKFIL